MWKRNQRASSADENVTEDFRGRVHPADDPEDDDVAVEIEADEDFTGRVRTGERFRVR